MFMRTCFIIVYLLIFCFSMCKSVVAQRTKEFVRAPETLSGRELTTEEARAELGLTDAFVKYLLQNKKESKYSNDEFEKFHEQFGVLPSGQLTYQLGPGVFYILLTKQQVEAQVPLERLNAAKKTADTFKLRLKHERSANTVDHSPQQTAIRDQGQRGTCTAFATCAALEALLVRRGTNAAQMDLSENLAYYWFMKEVGSTPCIDSGISTVDAPRYLRSHFVCNESNWSYVSTLPATLRQHGQCNLIDTPLPTVTGKLGYGIAQSVELPHGNEQDANGSFDIRDTNTLEQLLSQGNDIVFGTDVAWFTPDLAGIVDVRLGPAGQPIASSGGHAMLMVGYDKTGDKPFVIVKNSWGTARGHNGYLWISYDYIRTYAKYGYLISEPSSGIISGVD